MDTQNLIEKANSGTLTSEEMQEVLAGVGEEMSLLKEQKPEEYLELVKQLNDILESLNKDLLEI